jgi:hypothetical protein
MPRIHYADCPYSRKFDEIDVANAIGGAMEYSLAISSAYKHTSVAFIHQEGISNVICSTRQQLCPSFTYMDQLATFGTSIGTFDVISMNMHRTSDTDTPVHIPDPGHEPLSGMISSFILERLVFCRNVTLTHHEKKVTDNINPHSSMNIYLMVTLNISFFSS